LFDGENISFDASLVIYMYKQYYPLATLLPTQAKAAGNALPAYSNKWKQAAST